MSSARSSFTHVESDHAVVPIKSSRVNSAVCTAPTKSFTPAQCLTNCNISAENNWQHDPQNPRNWTTSKKWCSVAIVSLYTFVSPLCSSILAPGLEHISTKYGIQDATILAMTLSIFLLSFAIGPLFLAPLSVLHIGNLFTIIFNVGCAFAPTTGVLLVFRFLTGLSGSAPIACGAAVISDLFSEHERASAMAIYTLGPLVGPVVGPIAGGFICQAVGIKYVFITLAAVTGFSSLIGIPILRHVKLSRETYGPLLQLKSATRSTDPEKPLAQTEKPPRTWSYIWINLSRPLSLLFKSLICFMLSLYMALRVMYGIYYLFFATLSGLFSTTYGFSTGVGGLAYLGMGLGFFISASLAARFSNALYKHLADKNGGVGEPEMRIPALFIGSIFVPIGLLWYGWSAEAQVHWIMPIIGSGIFGFGMMATFLPIQLYLVDSFKYAASALSAAFVLRSLLGFAFPLFGHQMFVTLGFGGGNSLLAVRLLGAHYILSAIYLHYRGAYLRAKSDLNR
ncbi:major facilitator superfamily domain-containing protein [Mycena rebaudengoi]|nr:major facilitator superfamily domain-containing protein [Mycena rebaudengoi]